MTTTTHTHADVPLPAGAVDVELLPDFHAPYIRSFDGIPRKVRGGSEVCISGLQQFDGTADRWIRVRCGDADPNIDGGLIIEKAATAREIGQALLAAADELDGLEAQR